MTDWLMVVLTFVYVAATFFIYRSNSMAAKATREQVEELRKQNISLSRPYVYVTARVVDGSLFCLHIENYGKSSAENIRFLISDIWLDHVKKAAENGQLGIHKNQILAVIDVFCNKTFSLAPNQEYDYYLFVIGDGTPVFRALQNIQMIISARHTSDFGSFEDKSVINLASLSLALTNNSTFQRRMSKLTDQIHNVDKSISTLNRNISYELSRINSQESEQNNPDEHQPEVIEENLNDSVEE